MQEAIVETLRYVTPMGHDVLTYIIVDNLASPHRLKLAVNQSALRQSAGPFIVACPDFDSFHHQAIPRSQLDKL